MANLTPEQAKEFHEQFKTTYTAFIGLAAAGAPAGLRLQALVLK